MPRLVPTVLAAAAVASLILSVGTFLASPADRTLSFSHSDLTNDHGWFRTPPFFAAAGDRIEASATIYYVLVRVWNGSAWVSADNYSVVQASGGGFVYFADSADGSLANTCPPCYAIAPKDTHYTIQIDTTFERYRGYEPVVSLVSVAIAHPDPFADLRAASAGAAAALFAIAALVAHMENSAALRANNLDDVMRIPRLLRTSFRWPPRWRH